MNGVIVERLQVREAASKKKVRNPTVENNRKVTGLVGQDLGVQLRLKMELAGSAKGPLRGGTAYGYLFCAPSTITTPLFIFCLGLATLPKSFTLNEFSAFALKSVIAARVN